MLSVVTLLHACYVFWVSFTYFCSIFCATRRRHRANSMTSVPVTRTSLGVELPVTVPNSHQNHTFCKRRPLRCSEDLHIQSTYYHQFDHLLSQGQVGSPPAAGKWHHHARPSNIDNHSQHKTRQSIHSHNTLANTLGVSIGTQQRIYILIKIRSFLINFVSSTRVTFAHRRVMKVSG